MYVHWQAKKKADAAAGATKAEEVEVIGAVAEQSMDDVIDNSSDDTIQDNEDE